MIKKYITLVIILISFQQNFSQTYISGGSVEGIWTKSNSPYIIENAILVPHLKSLIIEPGVVVEFQGSYKFSVLGKLNAIGTVNDSITFTTNNQTQGWLGVRFENTSDLNEVSNFSYCKFEYGRANSTPPLDSGGAIFIDGYSKVNISNSLIQNCYAGLNGAGIYCDNGSSPSIVGNTIKNNTADGGGGGIYAGASSSPLIKDNLIISNIAFGLSGAGIYTYDFGGPGSPIIQNNQISYNICNGCRGGGMRVLSNSAIITNNTITFNEASNDIGGAGVYVTSISTTANNILTHNIISNNKSTNDLEDYGGGGVYWASIGDNDLISNNLIANNSSSKDGGGIHFSRSHPTMINNTIVNNSSRNGGGIFCSESSSPTIQNSIIWGNFSSNSGNQLYLEDEASDPNIYYSNLEGGASQIQHAPNTFYLGEYLNNINSDPLFNNPTLEAGSNFNGVNSDWSLNSSSPCIDQIEIIMETELLDLAGNNRIDGNLIDMGCYEFQNTTLNIASVNTKEKFSVYPNPASEVIYFKNINKINELKITNVNGKVVKRVSKTNNTDKINISNLNSGVYFIQFDSNTTLRLIKK